MKRLTFVGAIAVLLAVPALGSGCGGSSPSYASDTNYAQSTGGDYGGGGYAESAPSAPSDDYGMEADAVAMEESADYGGDDWGDAEFESEPAPSRSRSVSDVQRPQVAQATPQPQPQQQAQQGGQASQPPEATDGVDLSRPLLIYTARFHLGVYEVTQTQDAILEQLSEFDVMLARRTDTELVVRVPAERFQQALDQIEGAGDVLHRQVEVQDVGEEFRDVAIRIRNAEVMRDRLERLLARADDVEGALAIERELQRLTDVIETLKGRQRFLSDRIRYSTITIVFQPRATEPTGPDGFTLPFDWLDQLGLSNLMRLR